MKFSPTTILGYLRLVWCAALLGHILVTVFSRGVYFIDAQMAVAYFAVYLLGDRILGAAAGHFTADNPPAPKANDLP